MDVAIREDALTITVVISTLTDEELTAKRTADGAVWSIAVMTVDLVRDSYQGNHDNRHQESRCLEQGDHDRKETLAMAKERQ